jgi:hypothetical protein
MYGVLLSFRVIDVETGNLLIDAQSAFARQRRRRRFDKLVGRLRGSTAQLGSLEDALGERPPALRRLAGLQAISLCSVVGTAEPAKARVFDGRFRVPETSRRRWEALWLANRRGAAVPPISVFRVGDRHYVDDGHHRVSVAKALGMAAIDAEVTVLAT